MTLSFFSFSAFLNFIGSVFLGILVYLKGKKEVQDKSFALYFFSVAFWSFGYYFWQISTKESAALFWSRVLMAGAIFIPIFYLHFIVSFLDIIKKYKRALYGGYGLAFVFLILDFTPYFVNGIERELFFSFWPKPGIFFHPFLFIFLSFVCYGWYLLIKSLQETTEKIKKQQIKYFLLGTGIGFAGGSTNYLLWYDIPIPPYGNILVVFGVLFVALAILRYHLFEIRVILTELLVGALGLILLILPFLMPTSSLKILSITIFLLFCIFGYYLIKVTHEESRRREEAERLAQEFERLNRIMNQFLLATQHHLRTPLTAIQGYLSMLEEGSYGQVNELAKSKIKGALEATRGLIRLINEFLDISQFQVGKAVLKKQEVDLKEEVLIPVVEQLRPEAEKKGLNFILKLPKPLPKIFCDSEKIKVAIFNIIDNAIKYTQKGEVKVEAEETKERKILIKVSDTGIGLTQEERENIFRVFFERSERARWMHGTGRGIGLYLSAEIIKAHAGKVRVESRGKDRGSTFYIELPIERGFEEFLREF